MSVPPPGGKPTSIRTGRAGYVCPKTFPIVPAKINRKTNTELRIAASSLAAMLSSMPQEGQRRGEVDAPHFLDAARAHLALDDLVAHEGEDAAADEERTRVAVPVDTRSAAAVVAAGGMRVERADLAQGELPVREEQHGGRFAAQLARGGFPRPDDRQAEQAVGR